MASRQANTGGRRWCDGSASSRRAENAQEKILATVIGHELYTNGKTVSHQM